MKDRAEIKLLANQYTAGKQNNVQEMVKFAFVDGFEKGQQIGYDEGYEIGKKDYNQNNKQFDLGYKAGYEDGLNSEKNILCTTQEAHQRGLEDAWRLTKVMANYTDYERNEIFNLVAMWQILNEYDYAEAKAKIDAWEQKKLQTDDNIRAGDEVLYHGEKTVVLKVDYDYIKIMYPDGTTNCTYLEYITKTGRHFDGIEEIMKQMQEK